MNEPLSLIPSQKDREDLSCTLKKLAWAYIFIYLDLNLGTVSVLPPWIGYIIILCCLPTLSGYTPSSSLLTKFCGSLIFYELFVWFVKCLGGDSQTLSGTTVLHLVFGIIAVYFHFQLLTDLLTLAGQLGSRYCSNLRQLRNGVTVLQTVFCLPLPWETLTWAALLLILVNLTMLVFIIVILFRLRREISDMAPR